MDNRKRRQGVRCLQCQRRDGRNRFARAFLPRCVDDTRASKWQVRGCSRCRADRQAGERQPRDGNGRWTAGEVVSVSGGELGEFAETKELRKAAMQYARDNFVGKSYVNESSGHEPKVTWQGVKHAASKSNSIELSLMVALDKVLMNAKYEGSFPNKLGRDHIIAVHKYSTGVRFGNKVLKIRIIAREKFDGIKHYDHFILKDK
ncbi:hypothetical protein NSH54_001529 [Neisseria gonorrhoeae]